MPRKEDIERFTQVLNSLGNEPAIRAARSETINEVPGELDSPEVPGELDSLSPEAGGAETGSPGESESLQDIFESLSALPDEEPAGQGSGEEPGKAGEPIEQESAGETTTGETTAAGPADEGLDFASLFGEEAAPEGIEELEKPAAPPARAREAGRAALPEQAPAQDFLEALPDEDSFSLPEGEAGSLESDLSQMETLPDEDVQREPGTEAVQEAPGAGGESFELPDLGDLSFSEPTEEPAAPATSTEPLQKRTTIVSRTVLPCANRLFTRSCRSVSTRAEIVRLPMLGRKNFISPLTSHSTMAVSIGATG